MSFWLSALTAFLACGVEAVEAMTIVLAVGNTASWRSALGGAVWAVAILAAIVAVFGPVLHVIPLRAIVLVAGAVALYFGYTWTRKAILRYAGRIPMRDENAIYAREVGTIHDRGAFATAFNGVFVEGVEVIVIVISLGSASGAHFAAAVTGALASILAVVILGLILHRPAARVPENLMKQIVGIMLLSFGSFWFGEGLGIQWPLADLAIPVLAALYALAVIIAIRALRQSPRTLPGA